MKWLVTIFAIFILSTICAQSDLVYKNVGEALEAKQNGIIVRHIDLSKNKLSDVPIELREFTELTSLNLDKNKLNGLPLWLGKFQQLDIDPIQEDRIFPLCPREYFFHLNNLSNP